METILITGNLGYIGMLLTEEILSEDFQVIGVDSGFYIDNQLYEINYSREFLQLKKDIRDINLSDLNGVDSIIHLAALVNDPLCELNPEITNKINYLSTVRLAKLAKKSGVSKFLFSSSCSMYGEADGGNSKNLKDNNVTFDENSPMNPLSEYAKSKINVERDLSKLADDKFSPVYLRNTTAYGLSPNIRFDIVVNNLMGWAYTTKEIKILSDGKAWRPIVHIRDICNAFIAVLKSPRDLIHNEAFNVGINSENFQVKDIANEIQKMMRDCEIKILGKNNPDPRNYIVNFDKIKNTLKLFNPKWNLRKGIKELLDFFEKINLKYEQFQDKNFTRIRQLKYLLENRLINVNLEWL